MEGDNAVWHNMRADQFQVAVNRVITMVAVQKDKIQLNWGADLALYGTAAADSDGTISK